MYNLNIEIDIILLILIRPFMAITEITENIPLIKNPFNSYLNASKSSYRINELKELFASISERLNTIKNAYTDSNTENLIYNLVFKS